MKLQLFSGCWLATAVTTVLVAQPVFAQVVQVTKVQLNSTSEGIEVILETPAGEQLQVLPRIDGNTYIADIPNTQLRLPSGNTFRQDNPSEGIIAVTVTNQAANSIRVTVTGSEVVPTVELFDSDDGLIFSFTPAVSSTQARPQQKPPDTLQPGSETQQETTQPGDETPATPEAVEPGSEAQPDETAADEDEPIEIVVTGEQETGYSVPDATSVTRTDTPIRDIPQSIQVVPRQVLEDQNALRFSEIFRNVSSVAEEGGFGDTLDQFNIRGFSTTGQIFRDGLRTSGFNSPLVETANTERVEILKGPASVLFGALEPGGVVNFVTKKPLEEPFYSAQISVGSYEFIRPSIDLSGPLNADRTVLYRLNAAYETGERWRSFDTDIERVFIAPVLTWKISDRTNLTVDLEYLDDERPVDRGQVAIGRRPADIPRNRVLNEPDDFVRNEAFSVGYSLEHKFSENWMLRNAFRFQRFDPVNLRFEPDTLDETTGDLTREVASNNNFDENYILQTDFTGKFATGSVKHTLLLGFDLTRENSFGNRSRITADFFPPINIFNPIYNQVPRPELSDLIPQNSFYTNTDRLGIFLQDQIAFTDNLKLLVGGRFDVVDQSSVDLLAGDRTSQNDEAFSPRIGIIYQPIEPISIYASFTQSFAPNFGTTVDGSLLEPTRGTQYEVGVKGEFFDGRLSTTLAAYQITKTNIATTDLDNPDFVVPIGEQRSRGIELDVVGEILPGWNIIASVGYIDAEVTEDNNIPVGSLIYNIPEYTASLWTTYEIPRGGLQGLGFGVGLFAVGEKPGDSENTYVLPSYLRTDAAIYYRRDNWRAAINIKNLFDVKYYESVNYGRVAIKVGAPFTVVGTFSVEF